VIIDEVHSSQTGETSKHLKKTISKGESGEEEDEELPDYEDLIREEIRNRGRLFSAAGSVSSRRTTMNPCCRRCLSIRNCCRLERRLKFPEFFVDKTLELFFPGKFKYVLAYKK